MEGRQIYLYDARYNLKTKTTWEKLEGITGSTKEALMVVRARKEKIPRLDYCYIADCKTTKQQYRTWYEKVKFKNEAWKNIDDDYKISNYGRIKNMTYRNHPEGKLMLPYIKRYRKSTRLYVKIHGKETLIDILVGKYFVENPNNLTCLIHKNGLAHDNYHGNLEYCSKTKASSLGGKTRCKSRGTIVAFDAETGDIIGYYSTAKEAAKELYTNRQSVLDSLHRKIKKTMCGYIFRYEKELGGQLNEQ